MMNKTVTSLSKTYRQARKQNDGLAMTVSVEIHCNNEQPPKSQWLKGNKCIYPTQQRLLCVLATLHDSCPPHDDSPLHLHCQHMLSELAEEKREGLEHRVTYVNLLTNHQPNQTTWPHQFQEGEKVESSPILRRNILLKRGKAHHNDSAEIG